MLSDMGSDNWLIDSSSRHAQKYNFHLVPHLTCFSETCLFDEEYSLQCFVRMFEGISGGSLIGDEDKNAFKSADKVQDVFNTSVRVRISLSEIKQGFVRGGPEVGQD